MNPNNVEYEIRVGDTLLRMSGNTPIEKHTVTKIDRYRGLEEYSVIHTVFTLKNECGDIFLETPETLKRNYLIKV